MRRIWFAVVGIFALIQADIWTFLACLVSPGRRLGAVVTRYWGRLTLWGGAITTPVTGAENVRGGPFIIVANHSSILDICICSSALPLRFHFCSRPYFFWVPLVGWGMYFGGQISIDPKKPRAAARVLGRLQRRFNRGLSVLLFPEGTRSDGVLARYKRGPFRTAIRNGVPILPVHLDGVHERLPRGSFAVTPGHVRVTIGEPIPTAGLAEGDSRRLAKEVEDWTRAQVG